MGDNLLILGAVAALAIGLAFGTGKIIQGQKDDKKITYVSPGTKAEDIGSRQTGNLYPDDRYWLKCQREWKDNWNMRRYCENQQETAKSWAARTVVDDDIAHHCASEWPDDWNMFKYCANQQMEAKIAVGSKHH